MKSRWIIHNAKRIFIEDYSELDKNLDAVRIEIAAVIELLNWEPPNSLLAVIDVTYTYATDIQSWVDLLEGAFPKVNSCIKKRAIIRLSERRWYLFLLLESLTDSKRYRMFNGMREALDWPVSE
jgi:hypothetical protein